MYPNGQRCDGRYGVEAAAALLNVNISTVVAWCMPRILDGVQAVPDGPWWVVMTPEVIAKLRKPVPQPWSRAANVRHLSAGMDAASRVNAPNTAQLRGVSSSADAGHPASEPNTTQLTGTFRWCAVLSSPESTDWSFTACTPHPASRRRSYIRLQAGERMPGVDSHLSDLVRFQAHGRLATARGSVI
jgi:hypothetical protein